MDKDEIGFILVFVILLGGLILIVFINRWQNGFKTDREICEENGGAYIEDLTSHHRDKCMYGLKGEVNE